ncbi:hypothetical protein CKY51_04730 [Xanthomonas maliensis]|nr:hypothetical protein CKY51_04730 [Xanthomonas maliensis]
MDTRLPGCEVGRDGRLHLTADTLRQLRFDRDGLAIVAAGDRYHYVRRDGRTVPTLTVDNGPDPFAEGLVRVPRPTGVAFYDRQLHEAIPAVHTFAWPFADGVAQVCDGCQAAAPDRNGYTAMQGGRWYFIDRHNREVPAAVR